MGIDYQEEKEESADDQEMQNVKRAEPVIPYYSIILIACIVIVWIIQIAFVPGETLLLGGGESVLRAGFVKQLFLQNDEYWRILTGGAMHGGLIHLAFNGYALYVLGKLIEVLSNRAHLAIVFILSIIGGGILSLVFLPEFPSIGASGGIIGFLGYLTAYGFKRRKLLPESFLKNMLFNIGFITIMGVIIIPQMSSERVSVDNYAHLGGLLVGLIYGFIQIPKDLYKDPREAGSFTKILGYISIGIFILTSIVTILLLTGFIGYTYNFQ